MALTAKINKEVHGALSEELQKEYKADGDNFVLDVIAVDGLALENVTGLKKTVEKLRVSEKDLTNSVKAQTDALAAEKAKFAGIDATQAREAMDKIADIKNWDGETKIAEAVKEVETRHKSILEELNTKHKEAVTGLEASVTSTTEQLHEEIVTSKITRAIHEADGNVELLLPHVKNQVRMTKNSDGKFIPEVVYENQTPRIGDNEGNPMTITQLVGEMKGKATFAGAFKGVNSTGSGNHGISNNSGNQTQNTSGKVIAVTDQKGMSANLEDISTGKTKVKMNDE